MWLREKKFFQNFDDDYAPRYANSNSNIEIFDIRPNSRDIATKWLKKVQKPPILISKNYCALLRQDIKKFYIRIGGLP